MSEKVKRYLVVLFVAVTLLVSQLACDEEIDSTRKAIGTVGCSDPAARDACGENTHCRIEACN